MKLTAFFIVTTVMFNFAKSELMGPLGTPESNILTRESRHKFVFTGYPNSIPGGHPSRVADGISRVSLNHWPQYGYGTKNDGRGVAYLKVDLKHRYYVRAFAVNGYPGGNHKPTGKWYLEGSNDQTIWRMVGIADASKWYTPGTYPFVNHKL